MHVDETVSNEETGKLYYLREFKKQLTRFLDELIEQFPNEGDFVLIRIFVNDQIPMTDIMGRFIRDVLPVKSMVEQRNESFFLDNYLLALPEMEDSTEAQKINYFKSIWQSDALTDADREIMWKWVDVFVYIAELYFKSYGFVPGWETTAPL